MKEEKEKQSSTLQRNPEEKVANEERSEVPSATEKSRQESFRSPFVTLTTAVSVKLRQWKPDDRSSVRFLLNSKLFQNKNSPSSIKTIKFIKPQIARFSFIEREFAKETLKNHKNC